MKQKLWIFGLLSALALVLAVSPSEANFVQCPGGACGAAQGVTEESDLINGSPDVDEDIEGFGGDDVIFGNGSPDAIDGGDGNDIIFGGLGSDFVLGDDGDDIILPGPDTIDFGQVALGEDGNDTFTVFAGEIVSCLNIAGGRGHDVVNLVGFGPYSATSPYGVPGHVTGFIFIVDPITGGRIFVQVSTTNAPDNTEVINGLPTPNPVYITLTEFTELLITDPCPDLFFDIL